VVVRTVGGAVVIYATSPIKRERRTRRELEALRDAVWRIVAVDHPQTVRGVFYRAVSSGLVPKDERHGYDVGQRACQSLREDGLMPDEWITDSTRGTYEAPLWDGPGALLEAVAHAYRRNYWSDQSYRVEVWCEKDAMAGVLQVETMRWGVPLRITRGFASRSALHRWTSHIVATRKPTRVLYFGDFDPSGDAIANACARWCDEHGGGLVTFRREAVLEWQVDAYGLPTRPTKASDSRSRKWDGESVELDAIPAGEVRRLASDGISEGLDERAWGALEVAEASEREALWRLARGFVTSGGADDASR
jgi:hypothetical protein